MTEDIVYLTERTLPSFHTKYLANLNAVPEDNECISRTVKKKIIGYTKRLSDNLLNYNFIGMIDSSLPNGIRLVQFDFKCNV